MADQPHLTFIRRPKQYSARPRDERRSAALRGVGRFRWDVDRGGQSTFGGRDVNRDAAVAEILEGDPDPREYPASLIQPENGPTWMLDRAAASELT